MEKFSIIETENSWTFRKTITDNNGHTIDIDTPTFEKFERVEDTNARGENGITINGGVITDKEDYYVLHGKLNGSEVLCRVNKNAQSSEGFCEIETFGGRDVTIRPYADGTALIRTHDDVLPKCYYYDYNKRIVCSNIMDVIYDKNKFFLKSYRFGDKVRVFLGHLNFCPVIVRTYGCDANKDDVITFPLDDSHLIDEAQMMEKMAKDKNVRAISLARYQQAIQKDFGTMMFELGVYEYGIMTRIRKYEGYEDRYQK